MPGFQSRRSPVPLASLMVALTVASAAVAQPAPLGPEVALDPQRGFYYRCPSIAGRPDGRFAVGWNRDGGTPSLVVAVAGAQGEIETTLELPRGTLEPGVPSDGLLGLDASPGAYRALLYRFTGKGRRITQWARDIAIDGASASTPRSLGAPLDVALSPRPRGGYVAHWLGPRSLHLQLRGSDGAPIGGIVRLPVFDFYTARTLVHRSDGSFLVIYSQESTRDGRSFFSIRAQWFDANGQLRGRSFLLLPPAGPASGAPPLRAELGLDGTLAVLSADIVPNGPGFRTLTLRTFDTSGAPLSSPVPITTIDFEPFPLDITVDPQGRVLALWRSSLNALEDPQVRARAFTRIGRPLGPAFDPRSEASSPLTGIPCGRVAWAGDRWLIAWTGSTIPLDIYGIGERMQVYLRRFAR